MRRWCASSLTVPTEKTRQPFSYSAGGLLHLNMDGAPEFVEFAFQGAGEFVQDGGGLGRVQRDESFIGQAGDRAAQVGGVAVGFAGVEDVVQ